MPYKLAVAMLLAALPSIAVAGETDMAAAHARVTVEIHNFKFEPATLTVTAGTTVTWVNEDDTPHTVTDRGRAFRSAALDTKDKFSHTFATPGAFTYYCTLHPMMIGKVIIKPPGSSS